MVFRTGSIYISNNHIVYLDPAASSKDWTRGVSSKTGSSWNWRAKVCTKKGAIEPKDPFWTYRACFLVEACSCSEVIVNMQPPKAVCTLGLQTAQSRSGSKVGNISMFGARDTTCIQQTSPVMVWLQRGSGLQLLQLPNSGAVGPLGVWQGSNTAQRVQVPII